MTWLTQLSLRNRTLVGLASILVAVFGFISITSLKQELIPSLQLPVAVVIGQFPGASPTVVEQQVTAPVEAAVRGVQGVTHTESTSSGGVSVVRVEMKYGTDLPQVQRDLQQTVSGLTRLPEGVKPVVVTGSTNDIPVLQLAATSSLSNEALAQILRQQVVPLLEGLDGVNKVTVSGLDQRMITIQLDPAALAERGISPFDVTNTLQANGVQVPAGTVGAGERELSVQVGAPITSLDELRNLYLPSTLGGGLVRLGDIAQITSQVEPATGYSRSDGKPAIGIGVTKTADSSSVAVSHAIRDLLPQIEDKLGSGGKVTVVFDQAPYIEQSLNDLTNEGLLGLAFAVLVILLFLLSLRATLVTAVSIPLSLLVALIVIYLSGYSLNILTLAALTIAVGRVVDDSIVVIENIKRHLSYGEPMRQAVLTAVREVASAITASTITTVAVFLPIAFVSGQTGELFRPFAISITAALLGSLVVSLTIVPVLATLFLRLGALAGRREQEQTEEQTQEQTGNQIQAAEQRHPLQRGYLPVLRTALARPLVTCLIAGIVLIGTFALIPLLKTNFLDNGGQNTFQISQEMPPGTNLATTDAAARRVEQVLADTPEVESYNTQIGSPGGSEGAALGGQGVTGNTASFYITTDADADQTAVVDRIRSRLNELTDAGTITVQSGGGPGAGQLKVVVRAEDNQSLTEAANAVERAMRAVPGAVDVTNDLAAQQPAVDVVVDRRAAAAAGLSDQQIGQSVTAALRGAPVGVLPIDGAPQSVVLRTGSAPADLDALRTLPLGGTVRLGDVAQVREVPQPASISRIDGSRSASITATPAADDLGAVTADLNQRLNDLTLPPGATAEIGGVSQEQNDAFGQLGLALLLAVAIVYLVMVATFRSLVQPLLLLVSIPFAATGALGLLLITGTALGVPALIGMLMLIGIVVTNAIVLIDRVNQFRAAGADVHDAVINGARLRLRPILMTAVATICALFPMSLGLSGGGVFISQPLAVVVIGGLISSTALTLVLVPVLYLLANRARRRLTGGRSARLTGGRSRGDALSGTYQTMAHLLRDRRKDTPEPSPVPAPAVPAPAVPAPAVPAPAVPAPAVPARTVSAPTEPAPAAPALAASTPAPAPAAPPAESVPAESVSAESMPAEHVFAAPTAAQPSGRAVRGMVVTQDGEPLSGAVLTLVGAQGQQVDQATSGDDGRYEVLAPANGRYLLICRDPASNREPSATWVSVDSAPAPHHVVLTSTASLRS